MLLCLPKYRRPDISNPVRELSKGMKEATWNALKELKRILKYVVDTRDLGLKLQPKGGNMANWELTIYTDSDWAGDKTPGRVCLVMLYSCSSVLLPGSPGNNPLLHSHFHKLRSLLALKQQKKLSLLWMSLKQWSWK